MNSPALCWWHLFYYSHLLLLFVTSTTSSCFISERHQACIQETWGWEASNATSSSRWVSLIFEKLFSYRINAIRDVETIFQDYFACFQNMKSIMLFSNTSTVGVEQHYLWVSIMHGVRRRVWVRNLSSIRFFLFESIWARHTLRIFILDFSMCRTDAALRNIWEIIKKRKYNAQFFCAQLCEWYFLPPIFVAKHIILMRCSNLSFSKAKKIIMPDRFFSASQQGNFPSG